MLEVKSDNSIYLTKGDSGKIEITVTGRDDISNFILTFTVRNARNLDNEIFFITQNEASDYGAIDYTGPNTWTLRIYKEATTATSMKRGKYYYDFSLEGQAEQQSLPEQSEQQGSSEQSEQQGSSEQSEQQGSSEQQSSHGDKFTFVGGGIAKTEFWVT